jgi:hypothetical protein
MCLLTWGPGCHVDLSSAKGIVNVYWLSGGKYGGLTTSEYNNNTRHRISESQVPSECDFRRIFVKYKLPSGQ